MDGSKAVAAIQAENGHSIRRPEADPLKFRYGWEADAAGIKAMASFTELTI